MNLVPHMVIWAVLATGVVFLAVCRRKMGSNAGESARTAVAPEQYAAEGKLRRIDLCGSLLTAASVLYGLAIAGMHIYQTY